MSIKLCKRAIIKTAVVHAMLMTFASTQIANGQSCSGTLTGSGTFTSPNYPNNYPNFAFCQWNLTADASAGSGGAIALHVESLQLEYHFDSLEVYYGDIQVALYQASTGAHTSVFASPISVIFRSDYSITKSGFSIYFNTTGPQCGFSCAVERCTAWTPNFPNPYPKGTRCEWIVPRGIGVVAFDSTTVSVASFSGKLTINSTSQGTQSIIEYTGPAHLPNAAIFGESVVMTFNSGGCMTGTGFLISLVRHVHQCGETLEGNGTLSTPGYPTAYNSYTVCVWILKASPGKKVQLTVIDMELEARFDFVRVYSDKRLVNRYSGTHGAFTLVLGKEVTIEFQSDALVLRRGMAASFISVP